VTSDVIIIFSSIVVTSFISGLLSLGGGTILMGVFTWMLPVSVAMILHGVTQFASNGARAVVYRQYIYWPVVTGYVAGALLMTGLFSLVAYVPNKVVVFMLVGTLPFCNYLLPKGYALDVTRKGGGFICGAINTACMLTSGVSGPILDVFFVKTGLIRFQTIGTKGLIQSLAHVLKIGYFGTIVYLSGDFEFNLPWWVFVIAVVLSVIGNLAASRFIKRMTDVQFRAWSQRMTMAIGFTFLARGLLLWLKV
jgi:hypothetical protein